MIGGGYKAKPIRTAKYFTTRKRWALVKITLTANAFRIRTLALTGGRTRVIPMSDIEGISILTIKTGKKMKQRLVLHLHNGEVLHLRVDAPGLWALDASKALEGEAEADQDLNASRYNVTSSGSHFQSSTLAPVFSGSNVL